MSLEGSKELHDQVHERIEPYIPKCYHQVVGDTENLNSSQT